MRRKLFFSILLISLFYSLSLQFGSFSFSFCVFSQTQLIGQVHQESLDEILKKTGEYCKKLNNATFYFICLEEITEKINFSLDIQKMLSQRTGTYWTRSMSRIRVPKEKVEKKYIYDYQVIRKNNKTIENRTLLEENGKEKNEKDAKLKTINFLFRNVLFAPMGILSNSLQPHYDYKIIKVETQDREKVVILEAVPKPYLKTNFLYGKIWVRERDLNIIKIEWDQKGIGNYYLFEQRAKKYEAQPLITLVSELQTEKNGVRFPSRFYIEEAYILKNGKKFVRSQTTVVYKNFKFFTVEVEIK